MYSQLADIMSRDSSHINIECDVASISSDIDSKISWLHNLGDALHKRHFEGVSIQKLYSMAESNYKQVLDLSQIEFDVTWKNLNECLNKIQTIERSFKKYEDQSHPWFGRKTFAEMGLADKTRLDELLLRLLDRIEHVTLAADQSSQGELVRSLDTYLNHPGFMKRHRKKAGRVISGLLSTEELSEKYASLHLPRAREGAEWWDDFKSLSLKFTEPQIQEIQQLVKDTTKLKTRLEEMRDSLADFDSIQEHDIKKRDFPQTILNVISVCNRKMKPEDNWTKRIKQEIFLYWIDLIENDNPILKGQPFETYENHKKELARLIQIKKEIVKNKIQHEIESQITGNDFLVSKRYRRPNTEVWSGLHKELTRKRKLKPVRKLFEQYHKQLLQIAPCWLASPESVSKIFPLQRRLFDLVIVDEASQLPLEKALPFLYRADHVVVAGDEKQLQPFDLFDIKENEDEDDIPEDIPDQKSLLDFARTRRVPHQLNWHYRSRHQELINFSNHAFYEAMLQVAPNVINDPKDPHIKWIQCNGIWNNNQNHVECQRVIEEIKNRWSEAEETGKYPSVLVVTFNEKQKELIEQQIDKREEEDLEFAKLLTAAKEGKPVSEQLRVKNIENVQGDERDIVIFSVGYAKDPEGRFANMFGTLSHLGGENRLNVAITRARQEMIVVCSIEPSDIKPTSTNLGPQRLRQFLAYAKASSDSNQKSVQEILDSLNEGVLTQKNSELVFDSEFEVQVHRRLREKGYRVDTQVGHSGYKIDLAIINPKDETKYILGVECDGASFHSAKSVKERDVMRQEFLEKKGWKFARIWSRNWWKNPEQEISKIVSKVNDLLESEEQKLI